MTGSRGLPPASRIEGGLNVIIASLIVLAALGMPFAVLNKDLGGVGAGMDETLHTLSHLTALLGMSALFLQIMTGALRPVLRGVFRPRRLYVMHSALGIAGLVLLAGHFGLLVPSMGEHWAALNHAFFVLGPVALALLAIAVAAALLRGHLSAVWRRLHLFNYAVFGVGIVHALAIGTNTQTVGTRLVYAIFVALALGGLAYRISTPEWRRAITSTRAR